MATVHVIRGVKRQMHGAGRSGHMARNSLALLTAAVLQKHLGNSCARVRGF